MDNKFTQKKWVQEGIRYTIKDIPGDDRYGVMAPEVLESIKTGGSGTTPAMIKALQSGDYTELRKRPAPNDDITTCDIKQWEFAVNREGYDIMVTACCRKDCADTIKPAVIYLHGGGWCTGSRNNVQNPCRLLAAVFRGSGFKCGI